MAVRTTVDIPEPLHGRLRHRAERSGTSIRALIIRALEQAYDERQKGAYVTGQLVTGPGKLGPAFPEDKNPHDPKPLPYGHGSVRSRARQRAVSR